MSSGPAAQWRRDLASARRLLAEAHDQVAAHRKVCTMCTGMGPDANRYCDDGWALNETEWQAKKQVKRLEADQVEGQTSMF